jgi:hypothetical protein
MVVSNVMNEPAVIFLARIHDSGRRRSESDERTTTSSISDFRTRRLCQGFTVLNFRLSLFISGTILISTSGSRRSWRCARSCSRRSPRCGLLGVSLFDSSSRGEEIDRFHGVSSKGKRSPRASFVSRFDVSIDTTCTILAIYAALRSDCLGSAGLRWWCAYVELRLAAAW